MAAVVEGSGSPGRLGRRTASLSGRIGCNHSDFKGKSRGTRKVMGKGGRRAENEAAEVARLEVDWMASSRSVGLARVLLLEVVHRGDHA